MQYAFNTVSIRRTAYHTDHSGNKLHERLIHVGIMLKRLLFRIFPAFVFPGNTVYTFALFALEVLASPLCIADIFMVVALLPLRVTKTVAFLTPAESLMGIMFTWIETLITMRVGTFSHNGRILFFTVGG